jgi:hypothetical protein
MALSDSRSRPSPLKMPLEERSSTVPGPPLIAQITFLACCAHYPGGSEQVHVSVPSLSYAAFPIVQAGRHPRLHFRGLLELYACYGLPGCSPTKVGLTHPDAQCSGRIARQLPCQPMTTWVAPSSTGDLRRWGALNNRRLSADIAGANAVGFGKNFPAGFASRQAITSRRYEVAR